MYRVPYLSISKILETVTFRPVDFVNQPVAIMFENWETLFLDPTGIIPAPTNGLIIHHYEIDRKRLLLDHLDCAFSLEFTRVRFTEDRWYFVINVLMTEDQYTIYKLETT